MSDLAFPVRCRLGFYPQARPERREGWFDRRIDLELARRWMARRLAPDCTFAGRVLALDAETDVLTADALRNEIAAAALALRRSAGGDPNALIRGFALIREVSSRQLGERPYAVQVMAAKCVYDGAVVEMQTGEGKTLTAALAAGVAALGGRRVHLVTANDYLAERDAEWMRPVYAGLGLSVGCVVQGMGPEERRAAYACDITYCAGKEVAFDYLRDRCAMGRRGGELELRVGVFLDEARPRFLLPGLDFAIVDEADSVMIDEARTPLILSATPPEAETEAEATRTAMHLARTFDENEAFRIDHASRSVALTEGGRAVIAARLEDFPPAWRARPMREELVRMALAALHLHKRGEHYVVRDDKVEIVDEYTGRIMPDRSWSAGLHQAVEAKEGVQITARRETLAQLTYQRFFRRYRRLAGMTGTAAEAREEFWEVYRLPMVRIPTHRPSRRKHVGTRILTTAARKWSVIAERAQAESRAGRPVLVGCRTIAAAEAASAALSAAGVEHRVLSATQDAAEAEVIAMAGTPGTVTVATNMAGRGTDIRLAAHVADRGGLHVILSERHSAGRIDRQLLGRCGRQGDPGSTEAILSLEDEILDHLADRPLWRGLRFIARLRGHASPLLFDKAQRAIERRHARARKQLLDHDEQLSDSLAFAGPPE
jgi:preprotein translocase subunit SecA